MNLYIAGFNKGALIGHGAFGHVHKCDDPVHGVVAGKFIFANKFPDPNAWHAAKSQALNEAKNLSALEHPNTVRVFSVLADPADTEFLISCEFCEAGSARDSCKSNSINLKSAKGIVRDAAIGLSSIHSNGYIHRDIKPDNILLCSDGSAKVGDFGFVTDKLQFGFATPYGTPVYWAPEVFQTKACSNQSDVYSLGATLLHLVSGDSWFLRDRNRPLVATDPTGQPYLKENPVYLPHVPKDWRTKISKLLRHDSNRRCASMSEAVDLISTLGQVENWNCQVGADSIIWTLENGKRPIFVVWKDYFQKSSTWAAWSESLSGTNKRTLSHDPGNGKWYDSYRSLQSFFQERTDRIR